MAKTEAEQEAQAAEYQAPDEQKLAEYDLRVNPITALIYRVWWDMFHPGVSFIFTATTGRSGTGLIRNVFSQSPDCVAVHEPWPQMHGRLLIRKERDGDPREARRTYWTRKSVNVRRAASGHAVYVETNHLFIKSFFEYAIDDFGGRLKVLHLKRHPVYVARSIARLPAVPGTPEGDRWWLNFQGPQVRLRGAERELRDGGSYSHPFYRGLWYWYETETRIREMTTEHPWLDIHTLEWADYITLPMVSDLLDWAAITYDPDRISPVLESRVNEKRKKKRALDIDIDELHRMHLEFRQYLQGLGHSLPYFTDRVPSDR